MKAKNKSFGIWIIIAISGTILLQDLLKIYPLDIKTYTLALVIFITNLMYKILK